MFHVELEGPEGVVVAANEVEPLEAPVLGVERYFVERGARGKFEVEVRGRKGVVEEYIKPWRVGGGWRVEGREDREEFVMFTGWESLESYREFVGSEEGREYVGIRELAEGNDVKQAVRLEL